MCVCVYMCVYIYIDGHIWICTVQGCQKLPPFLGGSLERFLVLSCNHLDGIALGRKDFQHLRGWHSRNASGNGETIIITCGPAH